MVTMPEMLDDLDLALAWIKDNLVAQQRLRRKVGALDVLMLVSALEPQVDAV